MSPAPGYIQLIWPSGTLDILLGDSPPTVTQGYSKFNEIERPKRSDVIEYTGKTLFKESIPCMLDGWSEGRSVEPQIHTLELLSLSRGGKGNPPQDFKIDGPIPHRNLQWYIESFDWGDAIYDGAVRLRQIFVLNVVQKLDMPYILKNGQDTPQASKPGWRVVQTPDGDLRRLAQIMLGDSRLWNRMRQKNGKKFRDWVVPKNTTVRVPR